MKWLDSPASDIQITHRQRLWLYILAVLIMIFLVIPTLIVIPMSFSASQYLEFPPREWSLRWYEFYFNSASWMQATATSFKAAILTMLVATPVGVAAAYGLFVSKHKAGQFIFILLISPMMIPIILIAIGVFYVYVQIRLVNTIPGLVIAHTVHSLPLVLIIVSSALKSFDINLEMAARNLGASRFRAFMSVTLPQIKFAVVTAALLAFLSSFDEVIIAMFVSGGENSTLTRNMFNALRDQIDPTIA
ncbi:MAG: ABC transporter permease, partial [Aestuariibacter sp.]|nr:ABC transporter permease [Aestuariibacter sp.]